MQIHICSEILKIQDMKYKSQHSKVFINYCSFHCSQQQISLVQRIRQVCIIVYPMYV